MKKKYVLVYYSKYISIFGTKPNSNSFHFSSKNIFFPSKMAYIPCKNGVNVCDQKWALKGLYLGDRIEHRKNIAMF